MREAVTFWIDRFASPVGELVIAVDESGRLRAVDWAEWEERLRNHLARLSPAAQLASMPDPHGLTTRLRAYFAGELAVLDTIPVQMAGTAFQQGVWNELRRIPHGVTISYGELAKRVGKPAAVRAVGLANGSNPIPIVVPCHRVIGANGSLTGYGGGLERKRWLLAHERAILDLSCG